MGSPDRPDLVLINPGNRVQVYQGLGLELAAIEPPAGAPARAGGEALPLSAVFGDEPAVPPRSEPAPPAAAEPSYDEFFGAAGKESPPTGTSERNPEAEDLRQFNEWLKGLKR